MYLDVADDAASLEPFCGERAVLVGPVFIELVLGHGRVSFEAYSYADERLGVHHIR